MKGAKRKQTSKKQQRQQQRRQRRQRKREQVPRPAPEAGSVSTARGESTRSHLETELLRLFQSQPQRSDNLGGVGRHKRVLVGSEKNEDADVFEIAGFLSREECRAIIGATEATGFELTNQRETRYAARRRNGRIAIASQDVALILWARCKSFFPNDVVGMRPTGLSPNFRFYKYERGDSFGMHVDDSVDHGNGSRTVFTLLMYLNESPDVTGGETVFYRGANPRKAKEAVRFLPKEGSALAHIHGPRCMLHEGAPVVAGVKYLMRTDVIYK
eukprot:g3214.t1